MTAGHDHREPLDADERDLAARLARIGPLDGPSPSLDAKILAAAHAAAAMHKPGRRRHWLAWMGVPPALVTGVGVAAAAVLALGLVWQLRPRTGMLPAEDEATGVGEEVFIIAEPSATARTPASNPPPFPAEPASPAQSAPGATAVADPQKAAARAQAEKSSAVPPSAEATAVEEAKVVATQPSQLAEREAAAAAVADTAAREEAGFVAAPPPTTAAPARKQSHASYTTAARATAERRERAPAAAASAPQVQAADAEEDSATLDRIEVTGSRLKRSDIAGNHEPLAKVSVNDDTRLETSEWLERIRARRDEGDLGGARESLRLFRREHPRVRIPDDLRALLADASR